MSSIFSAFLLTFAGLFPIVNPIESAPFFFGMTASLTLAERNAMARKVAINGFALLVGSMVLGPYLLEIFGIRLPVVRIAGGFVVTALGWKLLTQEDWSDHADSSDLPAARSRRKIGSFYPLTMPLTVGPGSMSVAITIGSRGKVEGFPPLTEMASRADRGAARHGRHRAVDLPRLPLRREHGEVPRATPALRFWCACRPSSSCASASRSSGTAGPR